MMPEIPSLDQLPLELLELCVKLLDLEDMCNLRLTNVQLAANVSKGCYRTYFASGRLYINDKGQIAKFAKVMEAGWTGPLLRNLTVVTVVHATGRVSSSDTPGELALLGQAFCNLRRYSSGQPLTLLELTAESKDENGESVPISTAPRPPFVRTGKGIGIDRRRVWTATARCWHKIASALSKSKLPIGKLSIFGKTPQCSLAIDEFATGVRMHSLSASLAELRHLTLHISHHMTDKRESVERRYPVAKSEHSTAGVGQFMKLCPRLESLNLHWHSFFASHDLRDSLVEEKNFVSRISNSDRFPMLRNLTLHHLRVQGDTLLAFLRSLSPESVNLEYVILGPGTFRRVLDHLSNANLKHLSLYQLWDEAGRVSFGNSALGSGPRELMMCGKDDTSKHIHYSSGRTKTSARPQPPRKVCTCR